MEKDKGKSFIKSSLTGKAEDRELMKENELTSHTFLNLGTAVCLMQQSTREKKVFNFISDIVRLS